MKIINTLSIRSMNAVANLIMATSFKLFMVRKFGRKYSYCDTISKETVNVLVWDGKEYMRSIQRG